jgi:hypothetical protein
MRQATKTCRFPGMTTSSVAAALGELRREYAEVTALADEAQRHFLTLEQRRKRLDEAISSLEHLGDPAEAAQLAAERAIAKSPRFRPREIEMEFIPEEDDSYVLDDDDEVDGPLVPPDSPIAKYIKGSGGGRRLSSTYMIRDVVEEMDRVLKRQEVKDAFYQKFSLEDLKKFWDRPDNAFGTALNRAVKEKLIQKGNDKGTDVYASDAVVRRVNEEHASADRREAMQENGEL